MHTYTLAYTCLYKYTSTHMCERWSAKFVSLAYFLYIKSYYIYIKGP